MSMSLRMVNSYWVNTFDFDNQTKMCFDALLWGIKTIFWFVIHLE